MLRLGRLVGFLLLAETVGAVWQDCSQDEGITAPVLSFDNVTSVPEPVVKDQDQYIYKTITNKGTKDIANVTAELNQYWKALNYTWVRFLSINTPQCDEHPELCPLAAGKSAHLSTKHPKLNWLTPYGWYRSKQIYSDANTGEKIGCVDMQFRYCKSADDCEYLADNAEQQGQATLIHI